MKVQPEGDGPYNDTIRGFLIQQFPTVLTDKKDLLEAVSAVILGTNNTRYGPLPPPEVQVGIREVIRKAVAREIPIPALIPWGGRKTHPRVSVDVAEIMALKGMAELAARVAAYYPPGLNLTVRLEDTGALHLFRDEGNVNRASVLEYTASFVHLTEVMGLLGTVNPIPESTLMNERAYFEATAQISHHMMSWLVDHEPNAMGALEALGWKGDVPSEQQEFYLSRYRKLYPTESYTCHLRRLADYLAGSLARYKLGGTAAPEELGKGEFITLSYVPPIPGAPASLTQKRVYYRTLPANLARTHIPAWRGKGYLRIGNGNVVPKITSFGEWRDSLAQTYSCPTKLTSDDGGASVVVDIDYVLD